ncbi:calmodulin-lysine N-methyltransferase isoform X2 [Prosopis cineraria]|uniref:calmodulin-lysine N-methyltransferase isoform X2 n=1 Tax=Prosopis cineraria TaxID=364024 RepID=UPI0024107EF8|nr:calmodulin-lysine N-methyltransferase isoform X2 [Prosopis cineraria]
MENRTNEKASSLRWKILRQALLPRASPPNPDNQAQMDIKRISRRTIYGFNLIPSRLLDKCETDDCDESTSRDACLCYTIPIHGSPRILLIQRVVDRAQLSDFEICNRYNIDNTGVVCSWPSEDVLAYYCLSHADLFRHKKVVELGSGYGLAGFVIAAVTEASEVVISDGNPVVVNYIQRNIEVNSGAFGETTVKPMMLHWNQEEPFDIANTFDIIVASDCTFFKDFHGDLARIVKLLLSKTGSSEAIFLSPKRGNSLDMFLETLKEYGLQFTVTENYEAEVWNRHKKFMDGKDRDSWPSYEKDHCYPLLIRMSP